MNKQVLVFLGATTIEARDQQCPLLLNKAILLQSTHAVGTLLIPMASDDVDPLATVGMTIALATKFPGSMSGTVANICSSSNEGDSA